jgi:excisionase family DNA binding protein
MAINQIIRVSISEAAKLFGVNAQTIRRAIKSEDLSYVIVQGRYKISFESLLKWSQQHSTINNKMESKGIGQYVEQWKIRNKLYSPNPHIVQTEPEPGQNLNLFTIRPEDRIETKPAAQPKTSPKSSPQQSSVLPL